MIMRVQVTIQCGVDVDPLIQVYNSNLRLRSVCAREKRPRMVFDVCWCLEKYRINHQLCS